MWKFCKRVQNCRKQKESRLKQFKAGEIIMDIRKQDWNLFQTKVAEWQEAYMEKLICEYIEYLSTEKCDASEKFWGLKEKIKKDSRKPGVLLELRKADMEYDTATLIKECVITEENLDEFSEEFQNVVMKLLGK